MCYSMNSLFFQAKSQELLRQNLFILQLFILINNQLLSTANAKDINTDYYITNSTLATRYRGSVAKRVRTWSGLDVFLMIFFIY